MKTPRRHLALMRLKDEGGLTLVELLVAAAMSVIVVAAASSMLISAVRDQPKISKQAQNVSSARWMLERMIREIRDGIEANPATATSSKVSFETYVRRTACGSGVASQASVPAIPCQVTYTCTATACSRTEAEPGVETGTPTTVFEGIDSPAIFCYVPSNEPDPEECGPAGEEPPTYVRVALRIPDPEGSGSLTISDGATLRNATLTN
ncbi:MAG TPA: type II secretion system protein [Solirubrobacterales bacterium]|nr:type II secretion system protein [Solirubrobacterales bacterium]